MFQWPYCPDCCHHRIIDVAESGQVAVGILVSHWIAQNVVTQIGINRRIIRVQPVTHRGQIASLDPASPIATVMLDDAGAAITFNVFVLPSWV